MDTNDCHDPPMYWTIHGLWYDHRMFLFQPGKEKSNFVPECSVIWFCWVGVCLGVCLGFVCSFVLLVFWGVFAGFHGGFFGNLNLSVLTIP